MTLSAGQIITDGASFKHVVQDIKAQSSVCFVTVVYDQCIIVDRDVEAGAITLLSVLSQRVVRVTIGVTSRPF